MMFQIFNVYASRSSSRSAFAGFFENKWLLAAVALSLIAHAFVIYLPVLQAAFRTVQLSVSDWLIAAGVGSILLLVTEVAKAASRKGGQEAQPSPSSANGWPTAHA
jgi:Ca2+-transporting ATPase